MKNYRVMRTAGWIAVAGLLGAALVGPAATLAVAGPSVTPIEHSGNITTCPTGTTIFINGPKGNTTQDSGSAGGVTVNVTYTNGQTTVAFTVAGGVVNVAYIKGGPNYNEYNYGAAGTTGDTGLVSPDNGGGNVPVVSHSVFCVTSTTTSSSTTSTDHDGHHHDGHHDDRHDDDRHDDDRHDDDRHDDDRHTTTGTTTGTTTTGTTTTGTRRPAHDDRHTTTGTRRPATTTGTTTTGTTTGPRRPVRAPSRA